MGAQKPQRIAVIGAGISGVVTAAHLKSAGLEVTVFERNHTSGGAWLYDERIPLEPTYPAEKASKAEEVYRNDEITSSNKLDFRDLRHAPPGPCYDGLKNNVGTRLMKTTLNEWPPGTPDIVSHYVLEKYIQETSKKTGVDSLTIYGARVTELRKGDLGWDLRFLTLRRDSLNGKVEEQERSLKFDAVVVASGHYHSPRVANIPGLKDWKKMWPSRVFHSKAYRRPDSFRNKNVLLIGAGTSSTDIARELGPFAKNIYQSQRNGKFDLPSSMLPENAIRIGELKSFDLTGGDENSSSPLSENESINFTVTLKSGEKLCDIHTVIVCTGYHITVPFLPALHEDDTPATKASDTVLVTDGTQIHNLHKDIFYIPDPSLIFVGVPYFTATFTLFEFQALAVAQVLSGMADLPSENAMRQEYRERVLRKGFGKEFHSLRGVEAEYVTELLNWVNAQSTARGGRKIEGHSEVWHQAREEMSERMKQLFAAGSAITSEELLPACA